MSHTAGGAASFAALKSSIEDALVGWGWTQLSGLLVPPSGVGRFKLTAAATYLQLDGGKGASGSALTDVPLHGVRIAEVTAPGMTWPINYEVFLSAEEVVIVINYNVDRYQTLAFGVSTDVLGMPSIWINGSVSAAYSQVASETFYYSDKIGFPASEGARLTGGVFASFAWSGSWSTWYFSTAAGWYPTANNNWVTPGGAVGGIYASALMTLLPSPFNDVTVLLPVYGMQVLSGDNYAISLALDSVRHCRIDNNSPGEVVTYGDEQWKLFPFHAKNTSNPTPRNVTPHSGCYGFAVRYSP